MVESQGCFDQDFWDSLSRAEQAELIHTIVKGREIAGRTLYIINGGRRGLGAMILDTATATQYNLASSKGQKSAQPWTVEDDLLYSSASDPDLARDIYCFQHYAEKLIGAVPAEAAVAADTCDPTKRVAQLYNRDGMLGDRTQTLLENYARTKGTFIDKDKSIPTNSPLKPLADNLIASLSWANLEKAENDAKSSSTATITTPAPAASDMGTEYIELYHEQGRDDLIGQNSIFTPINSGGGAPPATSTPPSATPGAGGKIDEPVAKRDDTAKAQTKKPAAELSGGETDWTTVGLIAGGVVAVGAALYLTRPKKKAPVHGTRLRLPKK